MTNDLGCEPARLSPLFKFWVIPKRCYHNFADGSQTEKSLAVPFNRDILMIDAHDHAGYPLRFRWRI